MTIHTKTLVATLFSGFLLAGCGNGSNDAPTPSATCLEEGPYACKTGETEPLYPLQWALHAATSVFNTVQAFMTGVVNPALDLNVEPVHKQGIKGQGVNVIVLDDGLDVEHEDLKANVNRSMTFNFTDQSNNPTPIDPDDAHGTNVAGIIAAAQNGIGLMGIAPRATLGGADFLEGNNSIIEAMGGAPWSMHGHVFNGSYGTGAVAPQVYNDTVSASITAIRHLATLRDKKGALFIKAAGNQFVADPGDGLICAPLNDTLGNPIDTQNARPQSCDSSAYDADNLEPGTITVAALNAKGVHASYSNAGPTVWVSGYGGELRAMGKYGEVNTEPFFGPNMFSTDLMGCNRGYSRVGANDPEFQIAGTPTNLDPVLNNAQCNYSVMNGTSAATPSITGVVALILQANPNLTWRDVRFILAQSARMIDTDYQKKDPYLQLAYHMQQDQFTLAQPASTATQQMAKGIGTTAFAPVELGWIKNAAGYHYSNWYGFGLPDAAKAVQMAQQYTTHLTDNLAYPRFKEASNPANGSPDIMIASGEIKPIAHFIYPDSHTVDTIQLTLTGDRTNGNDLCLGRLALYLVSPSKTVSLLQAPNNIFSSEYADQGVIIRPADTAMPTNDFGLASMAFYGEPARGTWTIYGGFVNGGCGMQAADNIRIDYRVIH